MGKKRIDFFKAIDDPKIRKVIYYTIILILIILYIYIKKINN